MNATRNRAACRAVMISLFMAVPLLAAACGGSASPGGASSGSAGQGCQLGECQLGECQHSGRRFRWQHRRPAAGRLGQHASGVGRGRGD